MTESTGITTEQIPPNSGDRVAATSQMMLSLLVFGVFGIAIALAQWANGHDEMLLPYRLSKFRESDVTYLDQRYYGNPEERLLYNVIPSADYSHGGVYFVGGSTLQRSLMLWELPAEQRKYVGNYCIATMTHSQEQQFIRYLVEDRGLLVAGGDKNLIVFDLFFGAGCHSTTKIAGEARQLWEGYFLRYGMFEHDSNQEIISKSMPAWEYELRLGNIRAQAFWTTVDKVATGQNLDYLINQRRPPVEYRDRWAEWLGPDYESGFRTELKILDDLIDYLHARHVNVAGVFTPQGTWFNDFGPADAYRKDAIALCASKSVPIVDLSHELPDTDFVDSVHLGYQGALKLEPAFNELIRAQLRKNSASSQ